MEENDLEIKHFQSIESNIGIDLRRIENLFRRAEEEIWEEIKRLRHVVYGNGDSGMNTTIQLVSHTVSELKSELKDIIRRSEEDKRVRVRKEWAIITLLISLFAQMVFVMLDVDINIK